jgi:hypothetical protein
VTLAPNGLKTTLPPLRAGPRPSPAAANGAVSRIVRPVSRMSDDKPHRGGRNHVLQWHSMSAMAIAVLALATSATSVAHHSFAPYEPDVQFQLDGVVTKYQWLNPHVYIELDVQDESGETKNWLIEGANPGILNRVGWKWNMISQGDKISVIVSPLRNGEPGALLKAIRLPDGRTFTNGGPAGPAKIPFDAPAGSTP